MTATQAIDTLGYLLVQPVKSGILNKWDDQQSKTAQKQRSDSSHQVKNIGSWHADWRAKEDRINGHGRWSCGLMNLAETRVKATIPVFPSCCVMYLFFYLISFFFLFPLTYHWIPRWDHDRTKEDDTSLSDTGLGADCNNSKDSGLSTLGKKMRPDSL